MSPGPGTQRRLWFFVCVIFVLFFCYHLLFIFVPSISVSIVSLPKTSSEGGGGGGGDEGESRVQGCGHCQGPRCHPAHGGPASGLDKGRHAFLGVGGWWRASGWVWRLQTLLSLIEQILARHLPCARPCREMGCMVGQGARGYSLPAPLAPEVTVRACVQAGVAGELLIPCPHLGRI